MRGEVMLLNRDIMISGSYDEASKTLAHPEPWPCRVLISDFFDPHDLKPRVGTIHWDNIAIFNCSQTETFMPALKFDSAIMGEKIISNSAVSTGPGHGIHIMNSQRVTLTNNNIHDFVYYGLFAERAGNLVLEGNILSGVRPAFLPLKENPYLKWDFPTGAFELGYDSVQAITVKNNTASGAWHMGFRLPSKKCGDSNPKNKISDNVAHSISGFGVIVSTRTSTC